MNECTEMAYAQGVEAGETMLAASVLCAEMQALKTGRDAEEALEDSLTTAKAIVVGKAAGALVALESGGEMLLLQVADGLQRCLVFAVGEDAEKLSEFANTVLGHGWEAEQAEEAVKS